MANKEFFVFVILVRVLCFDGVKGAPRCASIDGGKPHCGADIDTNPPP